MFKVMLAPNQIPTKNDDITFPKYASLKRNGVRCLLFPINCNGGCFPDIVNKPISRTAKEIPNTNFQKYIKPVIQWCTDNQVILDGEIYSPSLNAKGLNTHISVLMSGRGKGISKEIPNDMQLHVFDMIKVGDWQNKTTPPYQERYKLLCDMLQTVKGTSPVLSQVFVLKQILVQEWKHVEVLAKRAWSIGEEGVMLRSPFTQYKHGRCSFKQNDLLKIKSFRTFDGVVIEIKQGQGVSKDAIRERDTFNRLKTVLKKEDKVFKNTMGAILVQILDKEFAGVTIKVGTGFNIGGKDKMKDRNYIWEHKEDFIGKVLEFKATTCGIKNKPLLPVFIRWRVDRD